MIRVCLAGVTGWVGQSLLPAVLDAPDLELTGAVSRSAAGKSLAELFPGDAESAGDRLSSFAARCERHSSYASDVLVDYTSPAVVKENVLTAIKNRVHVVIGTSGLTSGDYDEIARAARAHEVGAVSGANFAISAILLEQLAAIAARYLPSWEVIDYAKADKPDAPSGTARQLAYRLARVRAPVLEVPIEETHGGLPPEV